MLVQPDKLELGDGRLNEVENLAKLKENNAKRVQKFKIPGQVELENKDMAHGEPMGWQQLVYLLQKMNSKIICEDGGMKDAIAVRVPAWLEDGTYGKKYVTGFYKEVLPEFSWVTTDERGLPKREVRGWRTVVLALIRQGWIKYSDAVSIFGEPNGVRSGRWHELLRGRK
jgi:hypothetical protein